MMFNVAIRIVALYSEHIKISSVDAWKHRLVSDGQHSGRVPTSKTALEIGGTR